VAFLIAAIAWSRGITPDNAKKQVCRMVLVRDPRPSDNATFEASMTCNFRFLPMICFCTSRGSLLQTLSGPYGLLRSTVLPLAAASSMSILNKKSNLCTPMKFADLRRYGARIGLGPKRRCEIVYEPDFFES